MKVFGDVLEEEREKRKELQLKLQQKQQQQQQQEQQQKQQQQQQQVAKKLPEVCLFLVALSVLVLIIALLFSSTTVSTH